jgi:hypothetical protein
MQAVDRIARGEPPHARGSVGSVPVFPNTRNTIPGRVRLWSGESVQFTPLPAESTL